MSEREEIVGPSGSPVRLGKAAPVYDPRTLKLARYIDTARLPKVPDSTSRADKVSSWPMYANDRLGDCTCAGMAHMAEFWCSLAGNGSTFAVSDDDVISAYSAITGYDPATGANDNGAVEINVLNWWRANGLAGHDITAFAAVNIANRDLVRQATYLFDGLYIGVALPASAQGQSSWEYLPQYGSQSYPGSWGGHCVNVVDYDATGVTVITWGAPLHASWDFWEHYVDEAYAIIGADAFAASGKTLEGFDAVGLLADLESL